MKIIRIVLVPILLFLMILNISASEEGDVKESGTYFITISVTDESGNNAEREVRILITTRNTVLNSFYNEAIDGVDLRYHSDDFFKKDLSTLVRAGKVHAWDTLTGAMIPIVDVKISELGSNSPKLTFSTASKTKIVLNAYKTAEGGLDLENTYYKPINKKNYNLSNTIKMISALVFAPFVALLFSFLGTEQEYTEVSDTLFKSLEEKKSTPHS